MLYSLISSNLEIFYLARNHRRILLYNLKKNALFSFKFFIGRFVTSITFVTNKKIYFLLDVTFRKYFQRKTVSSLIKRRCSDTLIFELIYSVNLRIQSECGKIRTRKTADTDIFYVVYAFLYFEIFQYSTVTVTEH